MNLEEWKKRLVELLNEGVIHQGFTLIDVSAAGDKQIETIPGLGTIGKPKLPPMSVWYDLQIGGYVELRESVSSKGSRKWQVLLLPKLREENELKQGEVEVNQSESIDPRKVFVVHGRNLKIRDAIFNFLRAVDLDPIEWSQAIGMTGSGTPYIGQVLDVAFDHAQAVVVVMTPDDEVHLRKELWNENEPEDEKIARYQPRPNVLFEAGMAFGRNPDRTILIEIGNVKRYSDVDGRHRVRLTGSPESRNDLVSRLRNAGCTVDTENKNDWLTTGNFNINF